MKDLAAQAAAIIETYKDNKIIMDFVNNEALEQTAADIRAKTGSGTTAKAVELLIITNETVKARYDDYVTNGLIGCYMAQMKAA